MNVDLKLPSVIRGVGGIEKFSREVRKALSALRDQEDEVPNGRGRRSPHPFKLAPYLAPGDPVVPKLGIHYGTVWAPDIHDDSGTSDQNTPAMKALEPVMTGPVDMIGNPDGDTPGALTLALSTTYGVWIEVGIDAIQTEERGRFTDYEAEGTTPVAPEFEDFELIPYSDSAPIVEVDSTNTTASTLGTKIGGAANKTYIYVGQVAVDASGGMTVKQVLRGDAILPAFTSLNHHEELGDLDLQVFSVETNIDTGTGSVTMETSEPTTADFILYFRHGHYLGCSDDGGFTAPTDTVHIEKIWVLDPYWGS